MSQILTESIKKIIQTCFDGIPSLSMIWKLGQFIIYILMHFLAYGCASKLIIIYYLDLIWFDCGFEFLNLEYIFIICVFCSYES